MSYDINLPGIKASGNGNFGFNLGGAVGLSSLPGRLASLQTPAAQNNAANQVSVAPTGVQPSQFVSANQVQMPSWLNTNSDANIGELIKSYNDVPNAFDSSGQVGAINNSIGYQTASGSQAANNAATEYSNRAAQTGGSQLGAGVVKAQSMMPVYKANSDLRLEAANVAAQSRQQGLSLASQIANNIGQLRQSYLGTLADYSAKQQGMAIQNNQFNSDLALHNYQAQQNVASEAANRQVQYAGLQNAAWKDAMDFSTQQSNSALAANQALLSQKGPTGSYITNNQGQVTSGQNAYNALTQWSQSQQQAASNLRSIGNSYY